jgi:biofilm PGA synthesis N-glycosyltransferase PgaC
LPPTNGSAGRAGLRRRHVSTGKLEAIETATGARMSSDLKSARETMSPDALRERKYVVITPARNEAAYIESTLRSVIHQTIMPAQWVIVDDGSADQTGIILDRYADNFPWISILHREDRGFCDEYVGTIATILAGYPSVVVPDWEFLAFLDADIELAPTYFERCLAEFRGDLRLGIGGGELLELSNGVWKVRRQPKGHVRGATKIYRRACWDAIDLKPIPGYDTYDEIKAHYLGWDTRSFPTIQAHHLRPLGAAWGSWRDAVKNGHMDYFLGYHPVFMAAKCLRRLLVQPYLIDSLGHLWGYLRAHLKGRPRIADPVVIAFLRKQQLRKLLFLGTFARWVSDICRV